MISAASLCVRMTLDSDSALMEFVLCQYSLLIILLRSFSGTVIPTKQKEQLRLFGQGGNGGKKKNDLR